MDRRQLASPIKFTELPESAVILLPEVAASVNKFGSLAMWSDCSHSPVKVGSSGRRVRGRRLLMPAINPERNGHFAIALAVTKGFCLHAISRIFYVSINLEILNRLLC